MKKSAVFVLLSCLFVFAAASAQAQRPPFLGGTSVNSDSRPKSRTANPAPAPTATPASAPAIRQSPPKQPPVLIGKTPNAGTLPSTDKSTTATTAPAKDGEVISDSDDEVIKVETELVTIPVTVLDRQGRFIPGLRQADFRIIEDGKEQEISYFNTTEQPFTVILLLDVSNSTKFKIDEIQDAAIAFIGQLKQNDRVMIISFDDDINVLSEPTSDRNRLFEAVRRAQFGGGTSLYDAVDFAINRRLSRVEGRKAVVLFTDGVDTTSKTASYDSTVRDVEELDATFYTVYYNTFNEMQDRGGRGGNYPRQRRRRGGFGDILGDILSGGTITMGGGRNRGGGIGTSRGEYERGESYVEDLALKTGGRKYDATSTQNLETAFYNIAEELRRQYSLGYYPTESGQTGQRKTVKVTVNRSSSIVRARDSYIVGEQKQTAVQAKFR